jgi:hypothetical protein
MVTAVRTTRRPPPRGPGFDHPVGWFTPQPLWHALSTDRLRAQRGRPEILRFASDAFMEDLLALLASDPPGSMAALVAQLETWREPLVGLAPDGSDQAAGLLKLYQPSHQRFYLVAGALGCKVPGVPDREIDAARGESAFFVLRRRRDGLEYGWSSAPPTPETSAHAAHHGAPCEPAADKGWAPLQVPGQRLLCTEERLPLFPLSFRQNGVRRRLLAGLIPTASGETFRPSGPLAPFPIGPDHALPSADPRPVLFEQQVTGPLRAIKTWLDGLRGSGGGGVTAADQRQLERTGVMLMLDLMAALRDHLPELYGLILDAERGQAARAEMPANASGLALLIGWTFDGHTPLYAVLARVEQQRAVLEALEADEPLDRSLLFDWGQAPVLDFWLGEGSATITTPQPDGTVRTEQITGPRIQILYHVALRQPYQPPAPGADPANPLAEAPDVPKLDPGGTDEYVLRLVYERPACCCVTISEPTRPFTLAPYFDPDAPTRPIRIQMPLDTSPEGLRKFDKGVAFMLSDQLRKQMARMSSLKDLMDGDLGAEPDLSLGLICSFSIPIIAICALAMLMVMVSLLNIVFWWLPFFKICLPLNLKAR